VATKLPPMTSKPIEALKLPLDPVNIVVADASPDTNNSMSTNTIDLFIRFPSTYTN
jgi:hypothetical protein